MPKQQLHKRLSNDQVKNILARYEAKELKAKEAINYLEISRPRFYQLLTDYLEDTENFSINYKRHHSNRKLNPQIETNIVKELKIEKEKIIDNPNVPTKNYNYSYLKTQLKEKYNQDVSLSTIISRAKVKGYWKPKPPKKIHDREVITNYAGELIQHDSSHHLFAPDGDLKWYLVTDLDDYSRKILYADFWLQESTWAHILAVQSVFLSYGLPLQYYVDQHRIFRFVKDRDKNSPWLNFSKFTDDVDPQWKQVLNDCKVKPIYALSAPAKGKIERPYGWLQDHIVRTCVREGITKIGQGKEILKREVTAYNSKRVHSTTGEIPDIRFNRAIKENQTMFREFKLQPPFQSTKDIFCLRATRVVDAYRNVSLKGFTLKVPGVLPRQDVELRMYPDLETGIVEVRFWHQGSFKGAQKIKIKDLPIV